jgi:prepilin-type N-terminal cleavage/methylation domain-containing protein
MLKKFRKNKKGFTLTELIVVIAILGVLAAVVTPSVIGYLSDAKDSADAANLATIDSCVKRLVAKGTIDLNADWTQAASKTDILDAINLEIKTLPTAADTTKPIWVINKNEEKTSVWVTQEAASAELGATRIELNEVEE